MTEGRLSFWGLRVISLNVRLNVGVMGITPDAVPSHTESSVESRRRPRLSHGNGWVSTP